MTSPPTYNLEQRAQARGFRLVAGVDEVGRGPMAGPVVAAAVILPRKPALVGLADSKLLPPARREELDRAIRSVAVAWGIGVVPAACIDATDILRATHLAMRVALAQLSPAADFVLVDGRPVPGLRVPSEAVVGGDRLCCSVAAASILAKVCRDRLMARLDALYPGYGLADHKGYVTAEHCEAVRALGPCPVHRLSFEPLRSRGQGRLELE